MKALENAKVAMIPGVAFGKRGDDFVRIACTVSEEKLIEAAQRVKSFLEKGQ
jgi:aspartate/methionine/tyrosine aminotransferase